MSKTIKQSLKLQILNQQLQHAVFEFTVTIQDVEFHRTSWIAKSKVAKVGYLFSKSFSSGRGTTPRQATALLEPQETSKDTLWKSAIF